MGAARVLTALYAYADSNPYHKISRVGHETWTNVLQTHATLGKTKEMSAR